MCSFEKTPMYILVVAACAARVPMAAQAAPPGGARLATSPMLDDLVTISQRNRERLSAVIVEEEVTEKYGERSGEDAEARSRITRTLANGMDNALREARATDSSESTLENIQAKHEARMGTVEEGLLVRRLNKHTVVRRTRTIDFSHRQVRYDDQDPRDIEKLMKDHGLSAEQYPALSRTQSVLMNGQRHIRLIPSRNLAIVTEKSKDFEFEMGGRGFGHIPSWAFDGSYAVHTQESANSEGLPLMLLTCLPVNPRGETRVVLTTRADLGFLLTDLTAYDESGDVAEHFTASEYRQVDDVWIPFKTSLRRSRDGDPDYYVRESQVSHVRINEGFAEPATFEVPPGYTVQDVAMTLPRTPG